MNTGFCRFVRLCGVCLQPLEGRDGCRCTHARRPYTRGEDAEQDEICLPTGDLRFTSPAGRKPMSRVPTGFRAPASQISRKHWVFRLEIARVCPSTAELRFRSPTWRARRADEDHVRRTVLVLTGGRARSANVRRDRSGPHAFALRSKRLPEMRIGIQKCARRDFMSPARAPTSRWPRVDPSARSPRVRRPVRSPRQPPERRLG
jgi:hypothetical protein